MPLLATRDVVMCASAVRWSRGGGGSGGSQGFTGDGRKLEVEAYMSRVLCTWVGLFFMGFLTCNSKLQVFQSVQ